MQATRQSYNDVLKRVGLRDAKEPWFQYPFLEHSPLTIKNTQLGLYVYGTYIFVMLESYIWHLFIVTPNITLIYIYIV